MPLEYAYHYLSELLRARVRYQDEQRPFGRLRDLGAGKKMPYPCTVSVEVRTREGEKLIVPWTAVVSITPREIVLRKGTEPAPEADFWLRRDVLDDQVVDLSGSKVRRVNDVHLLHTQGQLIVAHAAVGILGILRRLRFDRIVRPLLRWLLDYDVKDSFVTWRHVEVISPGPSPGGLRVSGEPSRLAEIHPAELAEIMEQLGTKERESIFSALPVEAAAGALQEVDRDVQRSLVTQEEPSKAADILEEMPAEEAADVLRDLGGQDAQRIISRMEAEAADSIKAILAYGGESAGGVMTTSFLEAKPNQSAGEVVERVRSAEEEAEVLAYVYVVDDAQHVVGVLTLRELLKAPPEAPVESIMTQHVIKVSPNTGLKDLARLFSKYGFRSIPVADKEGALLGVVRLKSVLGKLSPLFKE